MTSLHQEEHERHFFAEQSAEKRTRYANDGREFCFSLSR
jgi:hypothetical protein